jgi:hypothetical protein
VRIVELRGPLGPGEAQMYRVRRKPTPAYMEEREDQLMPIPTARWPRLAFYHGARLRPYSTDASLRKFGFWLTSRRRGVTKEKGEHVFTDQG